MGRTGHMPRQAGIFVLVVLLAASGSARASSERLIDVLETYEADGFRFVYSTDLVRRDSIIDIDLRGDRTIARLRYALERIGLDLDGYVHKGETTWYVVPADVGKPAAGLEGRVTAADSGRPLAGVRVEVDGEVAFTDDDGRFRLASAANPRLRASREGYEAVDLTGDRLDQLLEIRMQPAPVLEEVVVVSSRYAMERSHFGSEHTLTGQDLRTVPQFGDDTLRPASRLPGTASNGLSARPYIRGGLQDETLVLFNNVELLEPFHLKDFQSVFSSFNPSLVDTVQVYTGGFPVRYGDRMSGVMDIKPLEPSAGFSGDLMLSFLTASAAFSGSTGDGRGSFALSARRGNLDLLLDVMDPDLGNPHYRDFFGNFRYALNDATAMEAGFIIYDDDVKLTDLDTVDGELGRSIYDNGYGWLQLHRNWSARNHSTTVLSYGRIRNDRRGFLVDVDLEDGNGSLVDQRDFTVWHLGHRQRLSLSRRLRLELGGRLDYQRGSYHTLIEKELGVLGALLGQPVDEAREIVTHPDGPSGGLFASARILPADWLTLEAGVRWDAQSYTGTFDDQVSPRFSALLALGRDTELRLSAGRFYQPELINELQTADGLGAFQPPQYSDHYIAGIQHTFPNLDLELRIEAFAKKVHHPKLRFENLFNPLRLMPELASDRIPVAPEKARARGVEVSLAYQPGEALRTWMSFTHAYADDELRDSWVKRGWDQRDTVSAGITFSPGHWVFSGAVLWHSGWQTTLLPPVIA
ncbi:MAG: TonB-dependent receptor, partial [Pseudomonadales bacterium]